MSSTDPDDEFDIDPSDDYYYCHEQVVMVPVKVQVYGNLNMIKSFIPVQEADIELAMKWNEMVAELVILEKDTGLSCVRCILMYLHQGNIDSAKWTYRNEFDKIRRYDGIVGCLIRMFGCHLHFDSNCDKCPCKKE